MKILIRYPKTPVLSVLEGTFSCQDWEVHTFTDLEWAVVAVQEAESNYDMLVIYLGPGDPDREEVIRRLKWSGRDPSIVWLEPDSRLSELKAVLA